MSAHGDAVATTARDVSVVIPVHRAGEMLSLCLRHLGTCNPRPGEVLVVADGPGDGAWRDAGGLGARVIALPDRVGPAAARNAGARAARGSILLFVDADVAVAPDAVGQAVAALREHPEWAAVFGSYDDTPAAANFVAQYKGLLNHYVHQRARAEAFTFWTALGAVRKDVFFSLGGLDPTSGIEDVDFGYRLRAAGHRVGVRKTLLATHLKPWRPLSLIRSDVFDRALPWTELLLRHRGAENDLNLDAANRLSVVCVFTLVAALPAALRWPMVGLGVAAACAAALLALNRGLYLFLVRKRGPLFLLGALPWHWLYFLYGGVAFGVGTLAFTLRRRKPATAIAPPAPAAAAVEATS